MFRGANKQKHIFKKNPKALIWGRPPKVIGGKLLVSGYWYSINLSFFSGLLLFSMYNCTLYDISTNELFDIES